jgi:MoxR-like ATPase
MNTNRSQLRTKLAAGIAQVGKKIYGYEQEIEQIFLGYAAGGHVLLEGVPGVAKTKLAQTLSEIFIDAIMHRSQGSPELMPADIIGFEIFNPKTGEWETRRGNIEGCHIFFYDEINRSTTKANTALLQAMQEGSITQNDKQRQLLKPFFTIATENPLESEGAFPLPEAAADRFMIKVIFRYVSEENELQMVESKAQVIEIEKVLTIEDAVAIRKAVEEVAANASTSLRKFIIRLVRTSRPYNDPERRDPNRLFDAIWGDEAQKLRSFISFGAGPRAIEALVAMASARAFLNERDAPSDEDVRAVFFNVMRHRFVLSPLAGPNGFSLEKFLADLLERVPLVAGEILDHEISAGEHPQNEVKARPWWLAWLPKPRAKQPRVTKNLPATS